MGMVVVSRSKRQQLWTPWVPYEKARHQREAMPGFGRSEDHTPLRPASKLSLSRKDPLGGLSDLGLIPEPCQRIGGQCERIGFTRIH